MSHAVLQKALLIGSEEPGNGGLGPPTHDPSSLPFGSGVSCWEIALGSSALRTPQFSELALEGPLSPRITIRGISSTLSSSWAASEGGFFHAAHQGDQDFG